MGKKVTCWIDGEQMLPESVDVSVERSGPLCQVTVRGRSVVTAKRHMVQSGWISREDAKAFVDRTLGVDQAEAFGDE